MGRHEVFARMMEGLASEGGEKKVVMIDATYLKAHRTALSLRVKKGGVTTGAAASLGERRVGCTPSGTPWRMPMAAPCGSS